MGLSHDSGPIRDRAPLPATPWAEYIRLRGPMGIDALSDSELFARIADVWIRDRGSPDRSISLSASLRELLEETARRRALLDGSHRPKLDTPSETPASRRASSKPPR
jgi:hypothetical protein